MTLLRSLFLLLSLTVLSACGVPQITDYSDRSVGYVWVNLDEARGNKVVGGSFRNLQRPAGTSVYSGGAVKFGTGFLIYHIGLPPGPTKLRTVDSMFCIGLCSNTINVYDFGSQGGDVAAVNIRGRGVYDFGSYAIKSQSNGLFRPGSFDVARTNGPSRRQVLEYLLENTNDEQRPLVQAALNRL